MSRVRRVALSGRREVRSGEEFGFQVAQSVFPLTINVPEGTEGVIATFVPSGGNPNTYTAFAFLDALPSGLSIGAATGDLSATGLQAETAAANYTLRVTSVAGTADFEISIAVTLPVTELITFVDLVNESASPSTGIGWFAQPFVDGHIPSGSVPKLRRQSTGVVYDVQVSQRKMRANGSLEWGTICYRVPDIAASTTERYDIIAAVDTYDDTPTLDLNDLNATAGRDLKVEVTAQESHTSTSTAHGAGTALGFGTQVCAFNTISTVATRRTVRMAGPICYLVDAWGMFPSDNHLKGEFFVWAWDDGAAGIAGWGFMPIMKQDWRIHAAIGSGQNKTRRTYMARILDGATVLAEYNASNPPQVNVAYIDHYYRSWWGGCDRVDEDLRMGQSHWIAGTKTRPTHWAKHNVTYLIQAKKIAPVHQGMTTTVRTADAAVTGSSPQAQIRYRPPTGQSHRMGMGNAGGYSGRGPHPAMDTEFLSAQTAQRLRVLRLASWAGPHAPVHVADDRQRTRPGDGSADVANTIIPIKLDTHTTPDVGSYSGLAAPVYFGVLSPTGDLTYEAPSGGDGHWTVETNNTHAVVYSYVYALLYGDPWHIDANLSFTLYTLINTNTTSFGQRRPLNAFELTGAPSGQWSGTFYMGNSPRGVAWAGLAAACAAVTTPDDDLRSPFFRAYNAHCANYYYTSISFHPANWVNGGTVLKASAEGLEDTTFNHFCAMGTYLAYRYTGEVKWKTVAETAARLTINTITSLGYAAAWGYRQPKTRYRAVWNASTNPYYEPPDSPIHTYRLTANSTDNTFVYTSGAAGPGTLRGQYKLANGDQVRVSVATDNQGDMGPPAQLPAGIDLWVINYNNTTDTFQVCAEPPSATTPVNFDAFGAPTEVYLAVMSAANYTASVVWGENGTQAVVAGDDEPPIVWAVLVLAEREGHPDLGEVWMDGYQAYVQPWLDLANYGDKSWWRLEREL